MKASEVPIGTRVRWRQSVGKPTFEFATVIANTTRQGDEVIVVETEGGNYITPVNVNDVEVFLIATCDTVRERIVAGCEDYFSDATFVVYSANTMEYVDPNTEKRYSVKIEVDYVE